MINYTVVGLNGIKMATRKKNLIIKMTNYMITGLIGIKMEI